MFRSRSVQYSVCIVVGLWLFGTMPTLAQDPTAPVQMDTLEVIDVTPVGGTAAPIAQMPTNVQSVNANDFNRLRPLDVTDALASRLGSVHLNNLGSNPFQPDVSYRGFRGSPLLGLPQGISVFLDGARVNETFGDVVNWDLIPQTAIDRIELLPGSNPAFGLNTLGGALSLQTKTGFSTPGARVRTYGGNHARLGADAEIGGRNGNFGYYAAGEAFDEEGWRDFSNSDTQKLFAKGSWLGDATTVNVSGLLANSTLRGNGAVPVELLDLDRDAVFTFPDETNNTMGLFIADGTHQVSDALQISGTVYGRFTETDTFNGDDSDYGACPEDDDVDFRMLATGDPLCFGVEGEEEGEEEEEEEEAEGEPRQVFDQNGTPVVANENTTTATNNTTGTQQRRLGASVQMTWTAPVARGSNRLTVGGGATSGRADFASRTELGRLTESRGTVGSGIVDAGSLTQVETDATTASLYLVNTFTPLPDLSVTVSGRFNHANVTLDDQIGTALNGDHTFYRFNPAAGVSYQAHDVATVFANVSTSNRAPTPVELTCADPDDPCRLPNGFQADPPLDQVVATTFSSGLRGGLPNGALRWSASVFRTDARNDIYFISAGPARNSGFFDNVGETRRQGIEAMLEGRVAMVDWFASYTFLDATFRDDFRVNAPNHPNAVEGEIAVSDGNRLPLTPEHVGKVGATVQVTSRIALSSNVVLQGDQYIRGDESNQLDTIDPFAVWNLEANAQVYAGLTVFAKIDNVLDTEYQTAGLLGEPDEVPDETFEGFENPRFVTPGAPRMIRAGLGYTF